MGQIIIKHNILFTGLVCVASISYFFRILLLQCDRCRETENLQLKPLTYSTTRTDSENAAHCTDKKKPTKRNITQVE